MSFEIVCENCGALSSPSTGICPYCKSMMSHAAFKGSASLTAIKKSYAAGRLDEALTQFEYALKTETNLESNLDFLLLGVKILIETEGPTSRIKSFLGRGLLIDPNQREFSEYLHLIDAKQSLTKMKHDDGYKNLMGLIRRSPKNIHALFLMGTHCYWNLNEAPLAIRYLESCVSLRPQFLRAWGCLGAIYDKLGYRAQAVKAYRQCVQLETNPSMKSFFKSKVANP